MSKESQIFPIVPKNLAEAEFLYDPLYEDEKVEDSCNSSDSEDKNGRREI